MFHTIIRPIIAFFHWPLYARVFVGLLAGILFGVLFRGQSLAFGWTTQDIGELCKLYVQTLTTLATPLIFFAILDAFLRTQITGRQGVRMATICGINIAVAFTIGMLILNVWKPGEVWRHKFTPAEMEKAARPESTPTQNKTPPIPNANTSASLSPLAILKSSIPKSILQPFSDNMVLTVAVMAIAMGLAVRSLRSSPDPEFAVALETFEQFIFASFQVILRMLLWLIELAPFAIFLAVASVVGDSDWSTLRMVGVFLATICSGLALHSLVYYPLSIWVATGRSPLQIFKQGGSAILTGFSLNSSLATSPLTLEALRRMNVSDSSARLSACVGTNFNNDGVTLYEALTALFIAQSISGELPFSQQITILLAALVGSMGIAGIPGSGLIILVLVLNAAKLPESAIQIALPLVYGVDFVVARLRSAVNVMGDLQVAMLLDGRPIAKPDDVGVVALSNPSD